MRMMTQSRAGKMIGVGTYEKKCWWAQCALLLGGNGRLATDMKIGKWKTVKRYTRGVFVCIFTHPVRIRLSVCGFALNEWFIMHFSSFFAKSSSLPSPPTTKWALWVTKKRSFSWSSNSLLNRYLTACLITHQSAGKHCFAKCWDETPVSVWKEDNRVAAHCLAHLLVYWSFCFAEQ